VSFPYHHLYYYWTGYGGECSEFEFKLKGMGELHDPFCFLLLPFSLLLQSKHEESKIIHEIEAYTFKYSCELSTMKSNENKKVFIILTLVWLTIAVP